MRMTFEKARRRDHSRQRRLYNNRFGNGSRSTSRSVIDRYNLPENRGLWNQNQWLTYLIASGYTPKSAFSQISWDYPDFHERKWAGIVYKVREEGKDYPQAVSETTIFDALPNNVRTDTQIIEYLLSDYYDVREVFQRFLFRDPPDWAYDMRKKDYVESAVRKGMSYSDAVNAMEAQSFAEEQQRQEEQRKRTKQRRSEPETEIVIDTTPPTDPVVTEEVESTVPETQPSEPASESASTPSSGGGGGGASFYPFEEPDLVTEEEEPVEAGMLSKLPKWAWIVGIAGLILVLGGKGYEL